MEKNNKKIIIIGAGITGCTLANCFKKAGKDVEVFEKRLVEKNHDHYNSPTAVLNFPYDYDFIKMTDFSRFISFNNSPLKMIGLDYPVEDHLTKNSVPCYPIRFKKENMEIFKKYKNFAKENNIHLLGRLAEYEYVNMDVCVRKAIDFVSKICDVPQEIFLKK